MAQFLLLKIHLNDYVPNCYNFDVIFSIFLVDESIPIIEKKKKQYSCEPAVYPNNLQAMIYSLHSLKYTIIIYYLKIELTLIINFVFQFLWQLIKAFPQCKNVLLAARREPLTAGALINSMKAEFSEEGASSRRQEEQIFQHFVRYLREVQGNEINLKL